MPVGAQRKLHARVVSLAAWAVAAGLCGVLVGAWLALGAGSPSVDTLVSAGAKVDELVAEGAWWRLVVAGALHTGPVHLALNAALLAFATLAWTRLGRAQADDGWGRALAAAAIAAIASAAGFSVSFMAHAGPSVGASAAVFGLLAAIVTGVWLGRAELPARLRWIGPGALTSALVLVVVASSTIAGLDHAAHAGGVVAGGGVALLVDRPGRPRTIVGLVAVALVLLACLAISVGPSRGT